MSAVENKESMLARGIELASIFCSENGLPTPVINVRTRAQWRVSACAYYRVMHIEICPDLCSTIGLNGRSWSCPGYSVDRTPYGVIQHEIGHHVDWSRGDIKDRYWSNYSRDLRAATGEDPISGYCENDAEWFAEILRLFITNPDFLKILRPRTYARLIADGLKPVFTDRWDERLSCAPERTLQAAARKVEQARKLSRKPPPSERQASFFDGL